MKTLYIILPLLFTASVFANELNWVDEQVEAIKPSRVGMSNKEISSIRDPFIFLNKSLPSKTGKKVAHYKRHITRSRYFKLTMVMNKSALINGRWYKEGSVIAGYKITEVQANSVLLVKHKKQILLSTQTRNKTLNFKNN